jgi:hypothetical protein
MMNMISTSCHNSSGLMDDNLFGINGSSSPYRFSDVHNKFTVIGCNTLAYIKDNSGTGYQSGCVSTCGNVSDLVDGSCSGQGCCQTAIPRAMDYYEVGFDSRFNTNQIWRFSRCSYAVLMEAEAFNFSTLYITTTKFNDTNMGQAPVVLDWVIDRNKSVGGCRVMSPNGTRQALTPASAPMASAWNLATGQGTCATAPKGTKATLIFQMDAMVNNSVPKLQYICAIFSL